MAEVDVVDVIADALKQIVCRELRQELRPNPYESHVVTTPTELFDGAHVAYLMAHAPAYHHGIVVHDQILGMTQRGIRSESIASTFKQLNARHQPLILVEHTVDPIRGRRAAFRISVLARLAAFPQTTAVTLDTVRQIARTVAAEPAFSLVVLEAEVRDLFDTWQRYRIYDVRCANCETLATYCWTDQHVSDQVRAIERLF